MLFFFETLRLGLADLGLHKLRSLLTMIGIIIGVAAVVAIAAYGEGAKQAALADFVNLGARNIIVRSISPPSEAQQSSSDSSNQRLRIYGLQRLDAQRIGQTVGHIKRMAPLKRVGSEVLNGVRKVPAKVYGAKPNLIDITSQKVKRGRYLSRLDAKRRDKVAVIGSVVARRLFPLQDPLGSTFRVDDNTFTVIGVFAPVGLAGGAGTKLVGRDLNFDIHIPMSVARSVFGDIRMARSSGTFDLSKVELSQLVIEANDRSQVPGLADRIKRTLSIAHPNLADVHTVVPLELIRQAKRVQFRSNVLMIVIGALSLLVGGVGIMNIMLASVTERTREIGIRRAIGATRHQIILQFLVETTVLSCLGGLIGIGLGLAAAGAMRWWANVFGSLEPPVVTPAPVLAAFCVATAVGIVFGLYPAMQAAKQDPIVALRHE